MSNTGTNDYNAQKLIPAEVIVSRTLQSKNRFWTNVIWRSGKPALDSEWNLINDMNFEVVGNLIRSITPSGWLDLAPNKYATGNSGIANNFQFHSNTDQHVLDIPNVIVNGWPLVVGGVNHTDASLNSITLPAATAVIHGQRYDFVFLEVWKAQVRSRDTNNNPIAQGKPNLTEVYAYGNTQYGGTHFPDDLVDPAIKPSSNGIETSERVQLQYRLRVVSDVAFANGLSSGFEDILKVQGQGGNPNPQVTAYQFINMGSELNDAGLWRSGDGTQAAKVALKSVDGYSYAIPMFKIYRRAQIAYSDTGATPSAAYDNQQGNATALSALISDRPDGKFYDGIDATDIIDLRLKASLDDVKYNEVLEKNLDLLLKGQLQSIRTQTLQYDSMADTDINGYTDFRSNQGTAGKRNVWSDASTDQDNIFAAVATGTTSNALDVYVSFKGVSANWIIGDQITIQTLNQKMPGGTIIKATPVLYFEDKLLSPCTAGTWAGLNTATAVFTFTSNPGHGKNIWVYYDLNLPVGQGLTHVADEVDMTKYQNYNAFTGGVVVRGQILSSVPNRFQDLFNHPFENKTGSISNLTVYREIESTKQRKQIVIKPLVQSTSVKGGTTRTLSVFTTDKTLKTVRVPHGLQHVKGVYTAASGGTEVATQQRLNEFIDDVDLPTSAVLIKENYYVAEITSLKYDSTGSFVGSEIELLVSGGGAYNPVFEHKTVTPDKQGTYVRLYSATGVQYIISDGNPAHFKWTGRRIRTRSGAGYGYDVEGTIIDCSSSDNNLAFTSMSDGQQLWLDVDYFAATHNGAEVRIIYKHTPYQGFDVGGQDLQMVHKRERGIFFNNGTGGGEVMLDATGTSNFAYTPVSPKLPGVFQDYLRDGAIIEIDSKGIKRFDSDMWLFAAYDMYGYFGGGTLWNENVFAMPASPEITSRGFLNGPMLEVVFELPSTDQTNAEFILPLLVKDILTNELYLFVQIGQKGVQKAEEGLFYVDLFRLNEKILIK